MFLFRSLEMRNPSLGSWPLRLRASLTVRRREEKWSWPSAAGRQAQGRGGWQVPRLHQAQQPPQSRRASQWDQGHEASPGATDRHLADIRGHVPFQCMLTAQWCDCLCFTDE